MQKRDLRKCKIFFAALLLCTQLFAHSGLLSGEKKLRVAKTKWFDIIYPARCEESAAILYDKADTVYEEVTAQYGLTPSFRMPVVITPAVDEFNAFWSAIPYNHIAIYDTGVSGASELAVFSETLLSTFRHELTHAVTYNMKNGFWRFAGRIIGDCFAPGMLSVTSGMAEGATVTSESAGGEGRLNNEYSKHFVKQAKIEDKFPAYHDVSGSADIQPGGAPYYFNGAFHQWLQENYGMEAYSEFWYRVVNGKNFTISVAFKKSFGIKLKKAWKKFEEDYEVPDIPADPVSEGLVQDFFEPSEREYSNLNDAGSLYESLTSALTASGKERLVWIDRYGGRVFMSDSFRETPVFRHIFSQNNITKVRLSNDARFLTVNYISENAPTETARVKIYDFDRASFYSVPEKGLKDALVVKTGDGNDGWYLVAQKYFAQHYSIAIYKLLMADGNRRISGIEPLTEIVQAAETNPYEFTALHDGTFAYLKKEAMKYSFCISGEDGLLLREFAFPEGMSVHSLSYSSDGAFYFSYVEEGTMPRLGKLELNNSGAELSVSSTDISGGVFEPVLWKDKIVYIGKFLRQNRILCMEDTSEYADSISLASEEDMADSGSEPGLFNQTVSVLSALPSKVYNPFPYIVKGVFVPASIYESDYFGQNVRSESIFDNFYLGATYFTANPWTNGSSELFLLTGGWNTVSKTFGTSLTINEGSSTSLFASQTQLKSEFDLNGWKQGGVNLGLSSTINTGRISSVTFSNTAAALLGRQEELYLSLSDIVSAQFSTLRRFGPGRFENAGFALSVSYGKWYETELTGSSKQYTDSSALAAGTRICIPHLLPFESKYGYTFNLPVNFIAKLLPSSSIYGYASFKAAGEENKNDKNDKEKDKVDYKALAGRPVFDAAVEVTAFSMDIQKAVPFITALYLNDFSVNLGYAATGTAGSASGSGFQTAKLGEYFKAIADGRGYYLDSAYAKVTLEFTPNIGVFAKPNFKMGVYVMYSYTLHSVKALKAAERTVVSLGLNANF